MLEEQRFRGRWWLPERPEHPVPGQLVVVPFHEAYVELEGDLRQDKSWGDDFRPPIVLGTSINGKNITLEGCLLTRRTRSFPGLTTLRLFVHIVYIGAHFQDLEEIHFKEISARYVNLEVWASYRSIQVDPDSTASRFTIHYEQPSPITVNTEQYDITFRAGCSVKEGRATVSLTEEASISISSRQSERPIDDFATIVRHFQNFLSLAIGTPTFPIAVTGQTESSKQDLQSGKEFYSNIEISYSAIGWNSDPKEANWSDMLFTLPDIQEQLSFLISNWLDKASELAPVFDLYFSTLYNPHLYSEGTFLNLSQAIETYHRRRIGGKYQTDDEYENDLYQRFVKAIPPEIDPGFKQSLLEGRLKYANEYSLRKRLLELVVHLAANNFSLDFTVPKKSTREFVDKVCDTRNFLTHYDQTLQERAASGSELIRLTMRLRGMLELLLLRELGFEWHSIQKMASSNRELKYRLGMHSR